MIQKVTKFRQFRIPNAARVRGRDLPFFCRSLAAMLNTGMPVGDCLRSLESQQKNSALRGAILWVRLDIESGVSLSDSLRQFPSLFDASSIGMIKAAELTGRAPETFTQIAGLLDTRYKIRRKIRSALVYPFIVMGLAMLLCWILVVFVVPVFASLYESLDNPLPAPTRALLASARCLRLEGIPLVIAAFILALALGMIGRTARGRFVFDRILLATPVAGPLLQQASLARFARTYAALIRAGIATPKAVEVAAESTSNRVLTDTLLKAGATMAAGEPLAAALGSGKFIPPMFIQMIQAGDKTGRTDEMLDSVAEFYESEVSATVSGISAIIMPLVIVVIGLVVGGIAVAALMPLLQAPGLVH